jgi:GNAT superfamily N-acetyltransferase
MSTSPLYRVATELDGDEAASLALQYSLFIDEGMLKRTLLSAKHLKNQRVFLAVDQNDEPVGVGALRQGRVVYIYVDRQFRRQGIGSMIAQAIKVRHVDLIGAPGLTGWEAFYKSNKIICTKLG